MAYEGPAEPADSMKALAFKTARDVGAGGPSAGLTDTQLRATPVPVSLPAGTLSTFAKTAGQTETIPVGAFQIGVIFLTGTGTVGGVDLPVGLPWNCEAKLAATVAVVCGSPGTARVSYLT